MFQSSTARKRLGINPPAFWELSLTLNLQRTLFPADDPKDQLFVFIDLTDNVWGCKGYNLKLEVLHVTVWKNHHECTFYISWMCIQMNTAALYIQNTINTEHWSTMFSYWEHFIIHKTFSLVGLHKHRWERDSVIWYILNYFTRLKFFFFLKKTPLFTVSFFAWQKHFYFRQHLLLFLIP